MGDPNNKELKQWCYWTSRKLGEVVFIVFVTLLVTALFSSLPFPAPGMSITEPENNKDFLTVFNKSGNDAYEGVQFDVNISANPDLYRYILYDNEFLQRTFKNLHWEPKIWVMARKNISEKWTPFQEVQDFTNGFAVVPVKLYVPATWNIAVFSLSERDDQIIKTYLTIVQDTHATQNDIEIPGSGFPKAEITVRTIAFDATKNVKNGDTP